MDPTPYFDVGRTSIKSGHASTAHFIVASVPEIKSFASRVRNVLLLGEIPWRGLRNTRTWLFKLMSMIEGSEADVLNRWWVIQGQMSMSLF